MRYLTPKEFLNSILQRPQPIEILKKADMDDFSLILRINNTDLCIKANTFEYNNEFTKKTLDYSIKVNYSNSTKPEIFLESIMDSFSKYGLTFRK